MTEKRKMTAKDLVALKFVGDPRLSPDGSKIVFTLTTMDPDKNGYSTGLWMAASDGSSGPRQMTNIDLVGRLVKDVSPRFGPCGARIAFLSNRTGQNQVWILPIEGGEPYKVTSMADGVSDISWSPDGKSIAFACREPAKEDARKHGPTNKDVRVITRLRFRLDGAGFIDPRPRHIWKVEIETGAVCRLTSGEWDDTSPAFSPDGAKIAFLSCREPDHESRFDQDVWMLDLGTGSLAKLTQSLGPCATPAWAPSGDWVAYAGTEGGDPSAENTEIYVAGPGGTITSLTQAFDRCARQTVGSDTHHDGAVPRPVWSKDGRMIYFLATDRGQAKIYRVPACRAVQDGESGGDSGPGVTEVVAAPGLAVNSFDVLDTGDGRPIFAYMACTELNPGDIYTGSTTGGGGPEQLTWVNEPLLSSIELSPHERITYTGDRGWGIEGWIMKPVDFEAGKKHPVVVQIHGGPAATRGEAFYHEYQLLASRGYGVFYMNFRGSKGYGEEFAYGNVGDWGGGDYRDIMAGVDYIEALPWVDKSRIYVTGGSFGGFMTNWILGHTHRFRAAVAQCCISNMHTKYASDVGWHGNKIRMGGKDLWDDEEFIMAHSPIRYAPNVRTPVLIVHGEEDHRCPIEQAEQWYVALKRLGGVEVEFVRFAGESHALSSSGKPQNRVERLERIIAWFDRHNP